MSRTTAVRAASAIAVAALLGGALAACSTAADDGVTTISYSTGFGELGEKITALQIEAFEAEHPDIRVENVLRPEGGEGDNLVKTQLATGEMAEVFRYQVGSLMQALNPQQTLHPMTGEAWTEDILDDFVTSASSDGVLYAAPMGTTYGAGVLYNIPLYEELGLEIPESWDEFMANSEAIQKAKPDVAPVLQAFGTTWTSQIFVLASFAAIDTEDPEWAEKYTANQVKYSDQPALAGFQHQQEVFEAGLLNKDFASMSNDEALISVATGTGAQYPLMTNGVNAILQNAPDNIADVGYFALPADDAANTAATIWQPDGLYIPTTAEGDKLEAARTWIDWLMTSDAACEIAQEYDVPAGPYANTSCQISGDIPRMVADLSIYIEEGQSAPALEFLSPIKGPNLENIAIEVGSGIRSAKDGAAAYDEDVKKQAQQLGIEGW